MKNTKLKVISKMKPTAIPTYNDTWQKIILQLNFPVIVVIFGNSVFYNPESWKNFVQKKIVLGI